MTSRKEVMKENLVVLDGYLAGKLTQEDVLDYLISNDSLATRLNFKDSLEAEISDVASDFKHVIQRYDEHNERFEEAVTSRSNSPSFRRAIERSLGSYVQFAELYSYLLKEHLSEDRGINYFTMKINQ